MVKCTVHYDDVTTISLEGENRNKKVKNHWTSMDTKLTELSAFKHDERLTKLGLTTLETKGVRTTQLTPFVSNVG